MTFAINHLNASEHSPANALHVKEELSHLKQVCSTYSAIQTETRDPVRVYYCKSRLPLPFRPTSRNRLFRLFIQVLMFWSFHRLKEPNKQLPAPYDEIISDNERTPLLTSKKWKLTTICVGLEGHYWFETINRYLEFYASREAISRRGMKAVYIWTAEVNLYYCCQHCSCERHCNFSP